ncbi:protein-L-isoaspartate(D-aspartate) O-methyltransferase [Cytophagaceae bacterium ABcell3]|nr:protein-L-isoaspartate(D-aspartate) O-methyltransferase [Cytophagaceae bacterium ABcell3]
MSEDSYKHMGMRNQLVRKLRQKGVNDENVLKAIGNVPRHFFFDKAFESHAYQDKAFPIGEGQTISQPFTVAVQTHLLSVKPGDKILEIGTGSGYQCCVLLELGARVYTIEYKKALYERAKQFLPSFGYKAHFFHGDGTLGMPTHAPYDKIIVTAGAPAIPETLLSQLNPGGIMVIPVGNADQQKMLRVVKKEDNTIEQQDYGLFRFVPLLGKEGW